MQIKADREGAVAIKQLCDRALRQDGLNILAIITQVLYCLDHPDKSTTPVPDSKKSEPQKPTPEPVNARA